MTSITLLSGKRLFWHLGLLLSVVGLFIAASAWMVHSSM